MRSVCLTTASGWGLQPVTQPPPYPALTLPRWPRLPRRFGWQELGVALPPPGPDLLGRQNYSKGVGEKAVGEDSLRKRNLQG